jgi:hypothetical protein
MGSISLESCEVFAIHSSSSSRVLRFLDRKGDSFIVEIESFNVTARQSVSAFAVYEDLPGWMEDLATHKIPWVDSKDWATLEGDFIISATCGSSGLVVFNVSLRGCPGGAEEWRVSVGLSSELGQLQNLARAARQFFEG